MKMSANENESVDIRLNANRRSNLIDLEELNRMERPSRVFSSRHHLSIPPALTETNNMEQNEQFRRSRDHSNSNYFENSSSSTRIGGSIANGDAARNRSPFVRFTITDPETQQITVAGQIPLNNTPPNTQTSSVASVNDISDGSIHDESDDEALNLYYWRNNIDQISSYNNSMSHAIRQLRNSRSGRRSRRFTDHPYFMRNNLDNNPSNNRTIHRRVRFSSTNRGYNDHFPDRSQTPEQELPEVLEHVMEPDNQYDEVYQSPDSMTSVSSHNDADFGDDRGSPHFSVSENHNTNADEENRDGTLDISNETPRTRVVPFIMSPTPFSPPHESPPDTPEIPVTRINNDLLNVTRSTRRRLPLIMNDEVENDEIFNHGLALPLPDYTIPGPSQFRCVVSSGILNNDNGSVSRTIDVELNNTENEPVNNSVRIDEIVDSANEDNNETILTNPHSTLTCAMHSNDQATEETSPIHVEEHPETYVDLNVQLLLLFECPVCFEHIIPPIFQCLLGHLICNKCVLMCENCPTCRNPFNSKRNLYMEKVCYLVKFPCINASTGCKLQMFVGQKEVHEKECCYRHYHCFFSNCSWRGYYPELRTHAINYHSNYVLTGSEQSLDIMLPNNNQTYQWFLLSHNECFAVIVHSSKSPKRVKLQVNFVGPAVKAKQFKFSVLLTQNKDHCDMPQKLMYERSTLPYSTVYEMLTNNGLKKKDIFSLPGEMLGPFIKKRRHCLPIILKVGPVSDL